MRVEDEDLSAVVVGYRRSVIKPPYNLEIVPDFRDVDLLVIDLDRLATGQLVLVVGPEGYLLIINRPVQGSLADEQACAVIQGVGF